MLDGYNHELILFNEKDKNIKTLYRSKRRILGVWTDNETWLLTDAIGQVHSGKLQNNLYIAENSVGNNFFILCYLTCNTFTFIKNSLHEPILLQASYFNEKSFLYKQATVDWLTAYAPGIIR